MHEAFKTVLCLQNQLIHTFNKNVVEGHDGYHGTAHMRERICDICLEHLEMVILLCIDGTDSGNLINILFPRN